ncbi:MAG: bifunctional folylpolyglutamate synthase/dihydrofolate synthase [Myxococcota bacterium]
MSASEIDRALGERRALGIRLGLAAIETVYAALGRPGAAWPTIHVVGTNGKGTTAWLLERALGRHGWRTGVYTSPHLHRVTERVRVDAEPVSEQALERALATVRAAEAGAARALTFFELLTLAGLVIFEQAAVDGMIVEAGLGGRRDATRIVQADAVAVTSIGLDHVESIGPTLADIAREKAGAMVGGVPTVSAMQGPEVEAVLRQEAQAVGSPLRFVPPRPVAVPGLLGAHQRHNAAVALAVGQCLEPALTEADLAGPPLPGRLERLEHGGGELWLDVAHNPEGIAAMVATIEAGHVPRPDLVVFGCHADKDRAGMEAALDRLGCPRWWVLPVERAVERARHRAMHRAVHRDRQGESGGPALHSGRATEGAKNEGEPLGFSDLDDPELWSSVTSALLAGRRILGCGSHGLVAALRAWAHGRRDPADPQDPRVRG